jgi:hypothetical protein
VHTTGEARLAAVLSHIYSPARHHVPVYCWFTASLPCPTRYYQSNGHCLLHAYPWTRPRENSSKKTAGVDVGLVWRTVCSAEVLCRLNVLMGADGCSISRYKGGGLLSFEAMDLFPSELCSYVSSYSIPPHTGTSLRKTRRGSLIFIATSLPSTVVSWQRRRLPSQHLDPE